MPQQQLQVGDGLVTAINQGQGWTAVPLNRTIQAMRQLGMDRVEDLDSEACFAGALSVLVLQSLPDDGAKLMFLAALAKSLQPGGQLVLVDLMAPERSPLQHQVSEAWLGFQRASGLLTPDAELLALTEGVYPIGEARLTALVNAAGFTDPARVFQALGYQGFLLQRVQ